MRERITSSTPWKANSVSASTESATSVGTLRLGSTRS
jgi:hypothetical protein